MKLGTAFTILGLGVGVVGLTLAQQGCSSETAPTTTGSSVGKPPAKTGTPTASTTAHNFALHSLSLGDVDRLGVASNNAWKKYGYNLDGKVSTAKSDDICTPAPGGSKVEDGENGIDNAFGARILPIILTSAGADAPKKISDSINTGNFTIMFNIVGLSDEPKQTNTGLTGQLFAGGKFPSGTPTWTTADKWPVRPELLLDGKTVAGGSKVKFTDAYIVGGTFVSDGTGAGAITISLAISGVSLDITINKAIVTFDRAGSKVTNGTIAGIIKSDELISGLRAVAGRISDSLCSGSAFDSIAAQIKGASDIMSDGSNAKGVQCDGISIGLGFTADEIAAPEGVAGLSKPSDDPCNPSDAGTGTDTGSDTGSGSDASDGGAD